jgi:hypothetical protein
MLRALVGSSSSTLRSQALESMESECYFPLLSMWSGITRIRYTDVEQPTVLAGSVILDNARFTGISTANIQDSAGTVVAANAANAANVPQWFQGNRVLGSVVFISRMVVLTDTTGQDRQNVICAGHTRPSARGQML